MSEAGLHPNVMAPRPFFPDLDAASDSLPFLELDDSHLHALRIEWRSPGGDVIDAWELVLQRDRYAVELLSEWEPAWTNPRIHGRLTAIARTLRRSRSLRRETDAFLRLGDTKSDAPEVWAPSLFWTSEARFVRPRCPISLEALFTCTDDAILSAVGLPGYTTSAVRFLYSPLSHGKGESRFYSADPYPDVACARPVEDLLTDQHAAWENARAQAETNPLAAEALAELTAADGTGPAAGELRVVNLHESFVFVRRRSGFNLLDAARLLARPAAEFDAAAPADAPPPGRCGRLFRADGSGLDALEILRLKLALIAQALDRVHTHYRSGPVPHLAIGPDAFDVEFPRGSEDAAALWNIRTHMVGLPAAAEIAEAPAPGGFLSVDRLGGALVPPVLADGRFGSTRTAALEIESVDAAASEPKAFVVLRDPGLDVPALSARDLVRIKTPAGARPFALDHWSRVLRDRDTPPGCLGATLALSPEQAKILARWEGRIPVHYLLSPCLNAPVDLHAMGVLLFAVLVGGDDLPVPAIAETLADWRQIMGREAAGGQEDVSRRLVAKASAWLAESRYADLFGRHRVFADPQDRREGRPNAIPAWIWRDSLVVGLRMVTWTPGFGFCADQGDFDPNYPAGTFEAPLAELQVLLERIDSVLLARSLHNREARHAIRAMRRMDEDGTGTAPRRAADDR